MASSISSSAVSTSSSVKLPALAMIGTSSARSSASIGRMFIVFPLHCRARHSLDGNGHDRGAVVEIDVLHRVMAVVVAMAVDVVILHEEHHRYADIGEDLPVRVVERAVRVGRWAHVAVQRQMRCDRRKPSGGAAGFSPPTGSLCI